MVHTVFVTQLLSVGKLTAIDWFTVYSGLPQLGIASEQTRPLRPGGALAKELFSVRCPWCQGSANAASESDQCSASVGSTGNHSRTTP